MKTFLARQPILNSKNETIGYELLFRQGNNNNAGILDDYTATLKLINDIIVNFGIQEVTGNKRAFVKFTEALILDGGMEFFKPEKLITEVTSLNFDRKEVMNLVTDYKAKGYLFATDKVTLETLDMQLVEFVDMIKIDFMQMNQMELIELVKVLVPLNKILIAEKVEDVDQYNLAKRLGFTMFQGHYFQKPMMFESVVPATIPSVYFELLKALNAEEINYTKVADTIKKDSAMTFSILKLINSVAYSSNNKITSIKDALVRMGEKESRRFLMINMLKSAAPEDSVNELLKISLRRGRQAERLAPFFGLKARKDELFLVGLLSLINIILRRPMPKILVDLPLQPDVLEALLGEKNTLSDVMEAIILFELEVFDDVERIMTEKGCDVRKFNEIYFEAVVWSESMDI